MAEKFPTPQERAMAWLLEAQEIRRHEQAGDRAVRLPTRLAGRHRLVHRNRTDNQRNGGRQVNRIEVLAATFDPCDYTRFAPEDNYTKKGGF